MLETLDVDFPFPLFFPAAAHVTDELLRHPNLTSLCLTRGFTQGSVPCDLHRLFSAITSKTIWQQLTCWRSEFVLNAAAVLSLAFMPALSDLSITLNSDVTGIDIAMMLQQLPHLQHLFASRRDQDETLPAHCIWTSKPPLQLSSKPVSLKLTTLAIFELSDLKTFSNHLLFPRLEKLTWAGFEDVFALFLQHAAVLKCFTLDSRLMQGCQCAQGCCISFRVACMRARGVNADEMPDLVCLR